MEDKDKDWKDKQEQLIIEIMQQDEKDGLYGFE